MKKTKLLQVRLTEQEDQFIEQKMIEHGYKNKSEYVLNSVISPIYHDKKRQQKMLYEVNKIGVNLNQAMRRMHATGFVDINTKVNIDLTLSALNEILEIYTKL
jgi:Arc/MetJ-type ribon-helix-helix transcriptional regulator